MLFPLSTPYSQLLQNVLRYCFLSETNKEKGDNPNEEVFRSVNDEASQNRLYVSVQPNTIGGLINFIEGNFKFNYLVYPVDKENTPGRRIPEKLGFSVFREYVKVKDENTFLNIIEYRKYYHI